MNIEKYQTVISRCCFLHEDALLNGKSARQVDEEIIQLLRKDDDLLASMASLIMENFRGEKRKDGSSRTLHAYDVARLALEGIESLHPTILKQWSEKEPQNLVFSALAHDLLEDGAGLDKTKLALLFSSEVSSVVFELTNLSQKTYEENNGLLIQKFDLFSVESAWLYPKIPMPTDHFHIPPSAMGAYIKLCDINSSLRANLLRGIRGWDREKYHMFLSNCRAIVKKLAPLNSLAWQQFQILSYQLEK